MKPAFIRTTGRAPGPGGYLLGVNANNVDFVASAWDEKLRETVLHLYMASGHIVSMAGEEHIEDALEKLGLSGVNWRFDLAGLESA
jgi:hypothetical protein